MKQFNEIYKIMMKYLTNSFFKNQIFHEIMIPLGRF